MFEGVEEEDGQAVKAPKGWIHKHVALQQWKASGRRPVVFQRDEGFYTVELPFETDWANQAGRNPGTRKIICGVTGITLWPDTSGANDNGSHAA
jgi:hypothetical protein